MYETTKTQISTYQKILYKNEPLKKNLDY